jgi:predicted dehydrogenase
MTGEQIPVAVVGAGNMGINHVRVYDEIPGAELVEVVEPNPSRADEIRENYGVNTFDSVADIEEAEAASVAVPNKYHRSVATGLIDSNIDILVEKPLAMNVSDAEAIVEAAKMNDVILQAGHIERFNPAVQTLQDIIADKELISIEAHRLGPHHQHITNESVVFDLMIHDLDIIAHLIGSQVTHLDAVGRSSRSEALDHAIATLQFEDGPVATTTGSHVTHGKVRELAVTTPDTYITLDYVQQDLTIQRKGVERTTALEAHSGYRTETVTESPFIANREPLKNELEAFLRAVKSRDTPFVTGQDGVDAVKLSSRVADNIRKNQPSPKHD